MSPIIAIRDITTGGWVRGSRPSAIIRADRLDDVHSALQALDQRVTSDRLYAIGFITYEASPAFDSALSVSEFETPELNTAPRVKMGWDAPQVTPSQASRQLPYVYFALFDRLEPFQFPEQMTTTYTLSPWQADISAEQFSHSIARIKQYIKQGDTYQVNFTFRQRSRFTGDPWPLFVELVNAQDTPYCAYIETDEFAVCSASPELFFKQVGNDIELRPMKGTVARGRTLAEDADNQSWLQQSPKDRAENLMIVDMIRNDVSHIAHLGSVHVPSLFDIERYPSIYQMTSTVQATAQSNLWETMQALFPCASITGAPKASTMAIIRELETSPRHLYTGSIGVIEPDGAMQFNVAIRTVTIDKQTGDAEYGVGSGIVWDSDSDREFAECVEKTKVLTHRQPKFELLESLLWTPDQGYSLLAEHLERLQQSAQYFDIPFALETVRERLQHAALPLVAPSKVRLTVSKGGDINVTTQQLGAAIQSPVLLAIATDAVSSRDVFLFHKTTHRAVYERHLAAFPNAHDVMLWNEQGQVTEGCWGNIAAWIDGVWLTPPIQCGVLAGVYRRHLLKQGRLQERAISVAEIGQCDRLAWFNSVRGWHDAAMVSSENHSERPYSKSDKDR